MNRGNGPGSPGFQSAYLRCFNRSSQGESLQRIISFEGFSNRTDIPFQAVKLDDEGIGEEIIIMDELAIRAAGTLGDTPAEGLGGAGEDLDLAANGITSAADVSLKTDNFNLPPAAGIGSTPVCIQLVTTAATR